MIPIEWNNITFIDQETGEQIKTFPNTISNFSCDNCNDAQIRQSFNVQNTYNFECTIKDFDSEALKEFFEGNASLKTASSLTDKLNDLIEEYHAPGTPRRERRAIKREFDKVFAIFHKHCQKNNIKYSFQRPSK